MGGASEAISIEALLAHTRALAPTRVVVVSGAGLSAASGIPTFRGAEGYWRVGSREYRPMEMATQAAFAHMPREVWRWYLYRRGVCRAAAPNAAHRALARLEASFGEAFALLSQNVDGLHLRAGNSRRATHEVHGNIDHMRCVARCSGPLVESIPEDLGPWPKSRALDDASFARLVCSRCGGPTRPHILWFDEYYDEALYRAGSAVEAAAACELIVFVGCSGAANLPWMAAEAAQRAGAQLVDIDPEPNPFAQMATERGGWVADAADRVLPPLVEALIESSTPAPPS